MIGLQSSTLLTERLPLISFKPRRNRRPTPWCLDQGSGETIYLLSRVDYSNLWVLRLVCLWFVAKLHWKGRFPWKDLHNGVSQFVPNDMVLSSNCLVKTCMKITVHCYKCSQGLVQASRGLVHERGRNGVEDWQENQWSICRNVGSVSICCGEERAEPKDNTLCLPVNQQSCHLRWLQNGGCDQSNVLADTDGWNEFPPQGGWTLSPLLRQDEKFSHPGETQRGVAAPPPGEKPHEVHCKPKFWLDSTRLS